MPMRDRRPRYAFAVLLPHREVDGRRARLYFLAFSTGSRSAARCAPVVGADDRSAHDVDRWAPAFVRCDRSRLAEIDRLALPDGRLPIGRRQKSVTSAASRCDSARCAGVLHDVWRSLGCGVSLENWACATTVVTASSGRAAADTVLARRVASPARARARRVDERTALRTTAA
jgi:hypothetical protein